MARTPAGSAPEAWHLALFFDADWFDAQLASRGCNRGALAEAAGLERTELHRLFTNERAPTAGELEAFAKFLGVDLLEVSVRSGVSTRQAPAGEGAAARIEDIEARLDEIDNWLAELEGKTKKRA